MTHNDFNKIIHAATALTPEQMQQLRDELDRKLASLTRPLPSAPSEGVAATGYKPIWEVAADIRKSVPEEEWAKLPVDGAEQLDHYIYGSPKRPAR